MEAVISQQEKIKSLHGLVVDQQEVTRSLELKIQDLEKRLGVARHNIYGVMEDVNGNRFVSGITLRDQNGKRYHYSGLKSEGNFKFVDIPSGIYTPSYFFKEYIIESPQKINVESNIDHLTIKLAVPTYSVSGKAVSSTGEALADQGIHLRNQLGNTGSYWPRTSEDGSFTMTGIPPGTYFVGIGSPHEPIAIQEITVVDGDVSGVIVTGN
jgi:hypothetical protein